MTVRPSKFVHVVYRTRRFEQMLAWYKTVFGATVQYQDAAIAFLTYDEEHHRFAFVNMDLIDPGGGGPDDRGVIGVDHVAYTYDSLTDLFDSYAELMADGITPYWCIHHGITASMYYGDPDGNQMEFQVDCLPTTTTPTPSCIAPSRSIRSGSSTTPISGSLSCGPARRSRTCSPARVICRSRRFALPLGRCLLRPGDEVDRQNPASMMEPHRCPTLSSSCP
jgi:catechol 2,3-dioxygenase-like lactoylglutathione lyase family enzyme